MALLKRAKAGERIVMTVQGNTWEEETRLSLIEHR